MNDQWLAWEHWNADGYCISTSKAHIEGRDEDGNETGRTACGVIIPEDGNGIVHIGDDVSGGVCKACQKMERKKVRSVDAFRVKDWIDFS